MSRQGVGRLRRAWGWVLIVLALWAGAAGAEVLRLKNGSKIEGTLKRTEGGYDVTAANGTVTHVDSNQVQRIELTTRPVGNYEAQQRLASVRRSVENLSDLNAIIDQFTRFIDQNKASPAARDAERDLALWRERRDNGMTKVGARWVTPQERQELLGRVGDVVEQARKALADGRTKEADALVQQALDVDPTNAAAAYLRGVLLFRHDQLQPARKAFDTSSAALKDHAPTLNNIAVILWRQNQQMAALNFYLQAMEASPGSRALLDNVAEALNALPMRERRFPLAQKAAREFALQDTELQRRMVALGWYRWGSTWVDAGEFARLQALEKQIKAKIDELSSSYDGIKKKVDQIDSDMDSNIKGMRLIEQASVGVDANGNVYQLPLPSRYYELQRENRQMAQDRAEYVTKLDGLRAQARRVQQSMPTPRFTGQLRLMGVEGTPGAPEVALTAGLTRPEPVMPRELLPPGATQPAGQTRPVVTATQPVGPSTGPAQQGPATAPIPANPPIPPSPPTPPLPAGIGRGMTTRPVSSGAATQPGERQKVPESLLAPG